MKIYRIPIDLIFDQILIDKDSIPCLRTTGEKLQLKTLSLEDESGYTRKVETLQDIYESKDEVMVIDNEGGVMSRKMFISNLKFVHPDLFLFSKILGILFEHEYANCKLGVDVFERNQLIDYGVPLFNDGQFVNRETIISSYLQDTSYQSDIQIIPDLMWDVIRNRIMPAINYDNMSIYKTKDDTYDFVLTDFGNVYEYRYNEAIEDNKNKKKIKEDEVDKIDVFFK